VLRPHIASLASDLDYVASLAAARAREAGLEFRYRVAAALPAAVLIDAKALRQVLINLVGNAVKFTDRGGTVEMRVDSEAIEGSRHRLVIEVEDSGIGIPESESERIFEPFHRLVTPGRSVEGTGLGLAVSRRVVAQMGGSLALRSRIGEGSCFRMELPVEAEAGVAPQRSSAISISGYAGPRRRLLIADDDPTSRELLASFLGALGFSCLRAADGTQACEVLERDAVDLVLTDLDMPGADGRAVLESVRRLSATLPVIAISASTSAEALRNARDSGFDDFLDKPIDMDRLLEAIGRSLDIAWQRLEPQARTASSALPADDSAEVVEPQVLERLRHHARSGDVRALLATLDASVGPDRGGTLASELRRLAREFDLRAVRQLLEG
jgi:CheY-like chemotaxis protein